MLVQASAHIGGGSQGTQALLSRAQEGRIVEGVRVLNVLPCSDGFVFTLLEVDKEGAEGIDAASLALQSVLGEGAHGLQLHPVATNEAMGIQSTTPSSPGGKLEEAAQRSARYTEKAFRSLDRQLGLSEGAQRAKQSLEAGVRNLQRSQPGNQIAKDIERVGDGISMLTSQATESIRRAAESTRHSSDSSQK